jgi:predicted Zn-dependent protease
MNKLLITLLITLSISPCIHGQIDFNNYATLLSKGTIPEDFTKQTYVKLAEDLKKGKEELSHYQERIFFEGTNYAIDEILHSGLVVYGDEISTYVSEIAAILLKNNDDLIRKLRFYTIKSNEANAFSTEQGIVFVTTGLIAQLTSEAQLAYILAHEISHYSEKHVVETFNWQTHNRRQDDRINRLSHYSKEKEFEADKLGIALYKEAGYDKSEIISTFDVLMYSYLPFDDVVFPTSYFNTPNFYVPKNCFTDKKFPIKAIEDYDDSESSHPNIKKRKEAAETELNSLNNWSENTHFLALNRFNEIVSIARFESIRTDIIDNNYADALYSIFLLEKTFPNSMYLNRMKAQAYINLMLFNVHNLTSETIDKTNEMEGESAVLHAFLKKLNRDGLTTLALRQVYDIYTKHPQDPEIKAIYSKFVKELAFNSNYKLENFAKKKFSVAAEEFIKAQKDTTSTSEKETSKQSGSKYDRIKSKKNINNAANFDSTKFYLYGIADILSDSSFLKPYEFSKKLADQKEKEKESYQALSRKEKKQVDQKEKANEFSIGLTETIVVEPMVMSFRKGELNNIKSEKLEKVFSESIENAANRAGVITYNIDRRTLVQKGTQGYNERSILINLLNQLATEEDVTIFPVDFQLLNTIKQDYGTSKVLFSLVEHEYAANISFGSIAGSILIYPILFFYVPFALFSGNNTEITVLILDLENGSIENGINYYFKDSPKKLQLGAHMYDILKKLKNQPIN